MKRLEEIVRPLRVALLEPALAPSAIKSFLDSYWTIPDQEIPNQEPWDILSELATDLEYYEPDPVQRTDKCLLDEERAMKMVAKKLKLFDASRAKEELPNQSPDRTPPSGVGQL